MHFFAMISFALIVAVVFALLNSEISTPRERVMYGVKVFAGFLGVAFILAWIMYPFPH